ncbi:MAG: hypothetical protein ACTSRK_02640 [Promethearchaeota archaeon]
MRKIHIVCPKCNRSKRIPVPNEIFNIEEGSLLKLSIPKGLICDHQFVLLIDYNFSIRDYDLGEQEYAEVFQHIEGEKDYSIFDLTF